MTHNFGMWGSSERYHHRYNLLREESEGYAKLVTLFNQFGDSAVREETYEAMVRRWTIVLYTCKAPKKPVLLCLV